MKYTNKAIGERIAVERKRLKMSQTDLASKLNLADSSRVTVGHWENGKAVPCLEYMKDMCEIFDCEMDYLFGKINERTREVADICAVTGLSAEAVELLRQWQNKLSSYEQARAHTYLSFINALICSNELVDIAEHADCFGMSLKGCVEAMQNYMENAEQVHQRILDKTLPLGEVQNLPENDYNDAMFQEYQTKELFGVFLERMVGFSKREISDLRSKFHALFSADKYPKDGDTDGTH